MFTYRLHLEDGPATTISSESSISAPRAACTTLDRSADEDGDPARLLELDTTLLAQD